MHKILFRSDQDNLSGDLLCELLSVYRSTELHDALCETYQIQVGVDKLNPRWMFMVRATSGIASCCPVFLLTLCTYSTCMCAKPLRTCLILVQTISH